MISLPVTAIQLAYLVAAAMFMWGLHQLSSPATARQGNLFAACGMLLAVVVTLLDQHILDFKLIILGLGIATVIGVVIAQKVALTAMPQLVGLFNGFGGAASGLVAVAEFWQVEQSGQSLGMEPAISSLIGVFVGSLTFTGSLIAFGKLQGLINRTALNGPVQRIFNILVLISFFVAGAMWLVDPSQELLFWACVGASLLLGIFLVLPIGGADMPVVISLLNSLSGVAASAAGFILNNSLLIIAGALVGASGLILTQIMCKGMNRSLANVLFSGFGSSGAGAAGGGGTADKSIREVGREEAAMLVAYARSVIIVPGYGMAVAQAQHAVKSLSDQLEKKGVQVKYAIHPVAGRMPGHMNVLLAEADVPYTQLKDMDDINPEFDQADVAIVLGANDVVNPAARHDQTSPLYGMPILAVDKAQHVIVIKRSMNPGYSGVDNELFYQERTMMLFGSAQDVVGDLVNEVKEL